MHPFSGDHQWQIDQPIKVDKTVNIVDTRGCALMSDVSPVRVGTFPNNKWWNLGEFRKDNRIVSSHLGNECYARPELCGDEGFTVYFTMNGKYDNHKLFQTKFRRV